METALFVVAFVSVSVAVVMSVLSRKDVRSLGTNIESLTRTMDATLRDELRQHRTEASESVHRFGDSLVKAQTALGQTQAQQIETLRAGLERQVDALRATVDERLRSMQDDNATRLDQMRQTVDEKLQSTLESRLGESFRQVSERLEQVYKGLGEMQVLATGVGDLQRVLANVKTRGTWGEVQLGALLEQVLAPDQYAANVATSDNGGERVEFAIRFARTRSTMPRCGCQSTRSSRSRTTRHCWRPRIDLMRPPSRKPVGGSRRASRDRARDISTKYLNPPNTTDFAIMFLPNEGLYAEVLRRPGLADCLQRDHRIVIAGPTTLWGS